MKNKARHKQIDQIADQLRQRRALLLQDVAENEEDLRSILEQRESEFEESAQNERITHLTGHLSERGQRTIREINKAFDRMSRGEYGQCENCGNEIGVPRLRALPTAALCIDCATLQEKRHRAGSAGHPMDYFSSSPDGEAVFGKGAEE